MLIREAPEFKFSEVTPKEKFLNRRTLLAGGLAAGATAWRFRRGIPPFFNEDVAYAATRLTTVPSKYDVPGERHTLKQKAITYNNFYEFGTAKDDPSKNAHTLKTHPWTVSVEGLVEKPLSFSIEQIMSYRPLEERVYRFRCVEAWSMVIPWVGYSLSEFIKACNPSPKAKYVQFISLADRKQEVLPFDAGISWPYSEGLRMDEAMHPLTLLTFGSYGETLENQQGAPIRVIIPWKYGFKSAKSIVKIRFTDKQPRTTWNDMNSEEYGFYSNVNPNHSHPRWSQAHERRIDASFIPRTIPTQPFNGYGNEVAALYKGMDLNRYY
ncbi:MAG: protein-methionine-sulfoxide reductase catalytic subunit MsrP [Acidobacteria bacterium]|nr:protein-methionine-sulfoxide reductase catalytic subunit MsrP [Acidobacteriota bacterium]